MSFTYATVWLNQLKSDLTEGLAEVGDDIVTALKRGQSTTELQSDLLDLNYCNRILTNWQQNPDGSTTGFDNYIDQGQFNDTVSRVKSILQKYGIAQSSTIPLENSPITLVVQTREGVGSGSVTSVGLVMPGIFDVANSPITDFGNLTVTLVDQAQNLVWASPDGSSGPPSFRAISLSDIPAIPITKLTTVLADADKVIRRDAAGVVISGNAIPNSSALVTTDATQTLTGKTIDGDSNTVQDLALTTLKTVGGDADKVLRRDGSGIVVSGNTIPNANTLVTIDAAQTLTNKTIDDDNNVISNLVIGAFKTVLGAAGTFFTRDGSGVVINTKTVPSGDVVGTLGSQTIEQKTMTIADNLFVGTAGHIPIFTASSAEMVTDSRFRYDDAANEFIINAAVPNGLITAKGKSGANVICLLDDTGGTKLFVVGNDMSFAFPGGTQAVAQTGYTTILNPATIRTFDSATVTLPQLAQAWGTLVEDLKAKALISA